MLWLGVAYLGALAALLITSLWTQDDFTGTIQRSWTLDNFRDLFTIDVYRTITLRTIGIAAVATVPIVVMLVYLAAARRTGALENL